MKHIPVESVEHLKRLLAEGKHEYTYRFGVMGHSMWIDPAKDGIAVLDYCDGQFIHYSDAEIQTLILNRHLYCETKED